MKALVIVAAAYLLSLWLAFPGYVHPLTPYHNDFYFPPGLSFDGHSLLEKLTWPRPLGFIAFQVFGKLGLHGYLFVVVCIALANAALMIGLARRILSRRVYGIAALVYCALLFAHPDFYVDYLHDAFATLSLFYLLLAMHAWFQYRTTGRPRYALMCGALMLLLAFTKETYFLSALCLWAFETVLRKEQERRAAAILFGGSLALFLIAFATNSYSLKYVVRLDTGAAAPYHVSLAPAALLEAAFFYCSHLFPVIALLAIAGAFALAREHRLEALGFLAAGICAVLPHALLPNHADSMYAWTGAPLAFAPVLFIPRPARSATTSAQAAFAALLVCVFVWVNRSRYEAHHWTIEQEKINRNIIASYPALKASHDGAKKILIAGLDMPFHPFFTSSYVRAEFGPERTWTVLVPRGQSAKSEPPVQLAKPERIDLRDYDYAFGFDDDGRLISQWTHAQLEASANPEQRDRILYPELNGVLAKNGKSADQWLALLRAGQIYWQWGQLESAANCLRRSAELEGGHNPYPFFFLGEVREDQGSLAEAAQYYAKALALDGSRPNPAFREALNRVQRK
jgi:Tetratricopeptide repeat